MFEHFREASKQAGQADRQASHAGQQATPTTTVILLETRFENFRRASKQSRQADKPNRKARNVDYDGCDLAESF